MKNLSFCLAALLILNLGLSLVYSQERSAPMRPEDALAAKELARPHFGPYVAISISEKIVRDVKVDREGNIFLQLNPDFKDKEIVVKKSSEKFASYGPWMHGGLELVSPANANKQALGWTDRVQTKARFIEYWMDGAVFLHLMKE